MPPLSRPDVAQTRLMARAWPRSRSREARLAPVSCTTEMSSEWNLKYQTTRCQGELPRQRRSAQGLGENPGLQCVHRTLRDSRCCATLDPPAAAATPF